MTNLLERFELLLQEKFKEEEYQHLFLVEIKQLPNDTIHVFIDSDQSLLIKHCVAISRYLEQYIEENELLGEKYTLDVSSPGVGAPLKSIRQYKKNINRNVSVKLIDEHKHVKGILKEVKEASVIVEYEEKVRLDENKKKKTTMLIQKEILLEDIQETVVKVSFK